MRGVRVQFSRYNNFTLSCLTRLYEDRYDQQTGSTKAVRRTHGTVHAASANAL